MTSGSDGRRRSHPLRPFEPGRRPDEGRTLPCHPSKRLVEPDDAGRQGSEPIGPIDELPDLTDHERAEAPPLVARPRRDGLDIPGPQAMAGGVELRRTTDACATTRPSASAITCTPPTAWPQSWSVNPSTSPLQASSKSWRRATTSSGRSASLRMSRISGSDPGSSVDLSVARPPSHRRRRSRHHTSDDVAEGSPV